MFRGLILTFALALFVTPATAQTFTKRELEAHLALVMDWWPGEYDNHEQIVRQSGGGIATPVYEPMFRVHSHYLRLDLPELGENVLYVEEYKNGDPNDIIRIRVYSLNVDEAEQGIRAKLHAFTDRDIDRTGTRLDPERLAAIKASDLTAFSDGCDVIMRFEGAQFAGGMNREACGQDSWFDYQLVLGPNHHWTRDRRFNRSTGEVVWEQAPGSNYAWIQMSKARRFSCQVLYNLEGDMAKTEQLTEIEVHDQGGTVDIDWPDGRTLQFQLHTREFASPSERTFPLFRIHEKGTSVPIAYGYTVDDGDRFGLNLGWFYTLCQVMD